MRKIIILCAALFYLGVNAAPLLTLNKGDHISLIGNALPDRMQHHGWLETLIYAKFPQLDLTFRNLSAPGDEVATWHRSENFGSRDDWLTKTKTDVIFAFYGYNESFQGDAGLPKFKQNLDTFIKAALQKKYDNGTSAPRLVLFSPIACEKSTDPDLPDPAAKNANLAKYTAAMAEVAKANNVGFVDLFAPSQKVFADAAKKKQSLTINTVHLNEAGDKALAPEIFKALFDTAAPTAKLDKLHAAVVEKSEQWHHRYRTMDGYNIYGGRSKEAYAAGMRQIQNANPAPPYVSNFQVMQQEMTQRDVMTANRDLRIWAVAKGGDMKIADANLPPVEEVATSHTNLPPYLDPEEAIKHMTVPQGFKVTLFASEKQFPELVNPVQMNFDTKGRLWVAAWKNYPERTPESKVGDSLLIFEDTKGRGKADKVIHYLDDLNCPTGFQFVRDGVVVMQAPDLWFVKDTKGGDKADYKERVLMGMDSADSHHTANSLVLEPGGAIYLSDGTFHRTQVESIFGPVRNINGGIYRYETRSQLFERYVPFDFLNPHGRAFDYWGNDIITDATGNNSYFGPAFSTFVDYPTKRGRYTEFWQRPSRPCAGTAIITSRHLPDDYQGNFLDCNVIGFQGIFRVKVTESGSGLKGETVQELVKSNDPNFRPSAVSVAPDGSIYFLDWSQQLIGHLQSHLRDPNRSHDHGRIYRMTYEGRPLLKPVKIDGQPIPALLEALKEPENDVRTRAKIELGKHDTAQVIAAVKKWTASLDKKDKDYEHQMTEALWVHQWHNVVNEELLRQMLRSPDYHARAAATRVLCYWRDRVKDPLALLKVQVADESPRVRLEAVRACSFFRVKEAAEIAISVLEKEADPKKPDYYIKYCLDETMKQLDKFTR